MEKLPDYSDKRFLIVDDEVFMLGLIDRMLKECKAGLIMKASDGGAALRSVKDNFTQVDCIIADFNMKPINGLQLLQGIRLGVNAKIPREQAFIMLTGHGESDVVKTAIALDVNGYIVKPVALDKLVATIDNVLKKPLEVKDLDYYRSIKVPKVQTSLNDDSNTRTSGWTVLARDMYRRDSPIKQKLDQIKHDHATLDGVEEVKIKNRRQCAVNELLDGQILAQDIEAEEGVILLRRGTYLTKEVISRLREIAAETNPNQTVMVGELAT
jgi:two-component system chemotaxis response regulator CheY